MTEDEFAKFVLIHDLNQEFLWIWKLTNNGEIDTESRLAIEFEAKRRNINIRINHKYSPVFRDYVPGRITVKYDHETYKVLSIDIGN